MSTFINICQLNATLLIRPKRQQEARKPLDRKALQAVLRIGLCRIWKPDIRKYVAGACLDRDALMCSSCHSGAPVGDVADLRRFLAALQTLDYRIDAVLALLSNL